MGKILVFGASGDTGYYFVKYFLQNNMDSQYELIAIGTRKTNVFNELGVKYYQVDITKKEDFSVLPKDVYAVVDLAGMMPARMKGYNPQRYIDVNITGTLNILDFCRENHADRILFSQSFGDIKDHTEDNILLTADLPRKFDFNTDHTIYVMSKNFAVDMIKNYRLQYGIKSFIFRLPTIYLWSSVDYYYVDGAIHKIGYRKIIDNAIAGKEIEVWGDAGRKKDMVYVKDFCQMLYKALFVNRNEGYYNVGTGIGTSLLDQIKGIIEVFSPVDKPSPIIYKPEKPNAPQYIMDISNAEKELGYTPEYSYIDMLKDMKKESGRF